MSQGHRGSVNSHNRRRHLIRTTQTYLRILQAHSESKKLMQFVAISGAYGILQLLYAAYERSVDVMGDALHNLFHCLVLFASLLAMAFSLESKDQGYTYGYDRCNVLAAFTNAVFLAFMALFFISEAIHHLTSDLHHHHHPRPMLMLTGFLVDLYGIYLFHPYANVLKTTRLPRRAAFGGGASSMSSSAHKVNLHSVFLHVFADNIKTMGQIVVAVVAMYRDEDLLAPLVSVIVALLILKSSFALIRYTCIIILQAAPSHYLSKVQKSLSQVLAIEGVIECTSQHWWEFAPGVSVGSVHLLIRKEADDQAVLSQAHSVFKKQATHMTIQIEREARLTKSSNHHSHSHGGNSHGGSSENNHNHHNCNHGHNNHTCDNHNIE